MNKYEELWKAMRDTRNTALIMCIIIIGLGLGFGIICLGNAFGLWLWKLIAVGVFGLKDLTFWQFFGLTLLCNYLFKSTVINSSGGK